MRGLLEKELLLLKEQRKYGLLLVVLTVFLSINSEGYFATAYLTFIAGFMVFSSFSYDDNGNCMPFLMTLPVSRRLYVKSKYVFGALLISAGWLCGTVVSIAVALAKREMPAPEDLLFQIIWLLVWIMILAFVMPLMFQYGAEKGRMVMLAVMLGVMAVGYIGVKAAEIGVGTDLDMSGLSGVGAAAAVAVMAAFVFVMAGVSYSISAKIVQNKEY